MNDSQVLLEIRGLQIKGHSERGWSDIVKGVDLTLKRGEVLGLIGESGAGKSTLGLAAMGFARAGCKVSGGTVVFDGIDLFAAPESTRRGIWGRRIAYVAQSAAASFNPAHRLIDQYVEGPVQHRTASAQAASADAIDLYRRMRLPNPETIGLRYPHQVSGGQLQRAMTAMAMACRPDLIIFDEPTTALDVTTQIEVLAAIRNIVRTFGTAAIYITHDLAVVAQMADRIKVLLRGEEVEEAQTREMVTNPQQGYTKSLWAVRAFRSQKLAAPAIGATPVLSVQGISASYGDVPVLHDVSFDIHARRTVAVVGESGSGKSTVARIITGLLQPRGGQVLFEGSPLPVGYRHRTKQQLRQVQLIYQMADAALNPRQRIREILGWPVQFYLGKKSAARDARVRELLALIDLEPDQFIDRYPGELSGGQKQRIGIARALAAEPRLLICDEITSALDQVVAEGILKLLDRLKSDMGLSFMFITHDLATVKAIADDVVVMKDGKVVDFAETDPIFASGRHPYTDLLLSSVPEMDPNWLDGVLAKRQGQFDSETRTT